MYSAHVPFVRVTEVVDEFNLKGYNGSCEQIYITVYRTIPNFRVAVMLNVWNKIKNFGITELSRTGQRSLWNNSDFTVMCVKSETIVVIDPEQHQKQIKHRRNNHRFHLRPCRMYVLFNRNCLMSRQMPRTYNRYMVFPCTPSHCDEL